MREINKKAWAVIGRSINAYGTIVEDTTGIGNVWQYPIFTSKKEAMSFKKQKGIMCKNCRIVPCYIYISLTNSKE